MDDQEGPFISNNIQSCTLLDRMTGIQYFSSSRYKFYKITCILQVLLFIFALAIWKWIYKLLAMNKLQARNEAVFNALFNQYDMGCDYGYHCFYKINPGVVEATGRWTNKEQQGLVKLTTRGERYSNRKLIELVPETRPFGQLKAIPWAWANAKGHCFVFNLENLMKTELGSSTKPTTNQQIG